MDCKLFQMMPYIIILKVRKFHQPTANRFSTAKQKPVCVCVCVGGGGGGEGGTIGLSKLDCVSILNKCV